MPDQEESTPAPILQIDPAHWEEHEGFRETFLMHFTDGETNDTLRRFGSVLFELILESRGSRHSYPDSATRWELRAALGDLRYLQGFLDAVGQEHRLSSLTAEDAGLSRYARAQAVRVRKIADGLEERLGPTNPG